MDARNEPATKGDLDALQMAVKADADALQMAVKADADALRTDVKESIEQLRAEVNHGYADLAERLIDSETRLLRAFYSFAENSQKRMTERELNEVSMKSRLATIEDRLLEVEKRLNMPPAA